MKEGVGGKGERGANKIRDRDVYQGLMFLWPIPLSITGSSEALFILKEKAFPGLPLVRRGGASSSAFHINSAVSLESPASTSSRHYVKRSRFVFSDCGRCLIFLSHPFLVRGE